MPASAPAPSAPAPSAPAPSAPAPSALARRRRGEAPHLLAAAIPSAIGVLLVVLGWAGVSGEAAFGEQMVGLNLAVLGALVVLVGCGFYLWVFRVRLGRRMHRLRARTLAEDPSVDGAAGRVS